MTKMNPRSDYVRENSPGTEAQTAPENSKKPAAKDLRSIFTQYKKLIITATAALAAVILLLVIVDPANSPSAVFSSYLSCMHAQDESRFTAISYDANFSDAIPPDTVAEQYRLRFSSADDSYKSGGTVDLLRDTDIRIIETTTPKRDNIASRRTALGENHRNTARITDIRNIDFEVTRGDQVTYGSAELICVTGKWYIGDVSGI